MKEQFLYLKDEEVIHEIRKHKWIESEKVGYEVGFFTAAYDWINHHSEAWLKNQIEHSKKRIQVLEEELHHRER